MDHKATAVVGQQPWVWWVFCDICGPLPTEHRCRRHARRAARKHRRQRRRGGR